jgi:hypothetical protein
MTFRELTRDADSENYSNSQIQSVTKYKFLLMFLYLYDMCVVTTVFKGINENVSEKGECPILSDSFISRYYMSLVPFLMMALDF